MAVSQEMPQPSTTQIILKITSIKFYSNLPEVNELKLWKTTVLKQILSWTQPGHLCFNSLAPGRSECDSKNVIFNLVLLIGIFRSSHDNALRWMPQDLTDDKSTFVQVMAWCRQATSHYLSQCWPRSLSPYGVIRPQWVNIQYTLWHICGIDQILWSVFKLIQRDIALLVVFTCQTFTALLVANNGIYPLLSNPNLQYKMHLRRQ